MRLIIILCFFVATLAEAQYQKPDTSTPLFDDAALQIKQDDRRKMAKVLALMVEAEQPPIAPLRMKDMRKLLGLALHLDPTSAEAKRENTRLASGGPWRKPARAPTARQAAQFIEKMATTCEKSANAEDIKLAGYLYAAADITDKSYFAAATAVREFEAKRGKIDWGFLDGKTVGGGGKGALFATGSNERVDIGTQPVDSYLKKNRDWQKRQVSLSAMMVRQAGGGRMVGTSMDCIMTVQPTQYSRSSIKFQRPVGRQMGTAMSEAKRLVQFRYPYWGSGDVVISFGDKYTPKDGGSAGTLFTLALLSLLDGIDYEENLAITGDVTVDWKVRKVGGVAEKLRGAVIAGCDLAIIPTGNEEAVLELVLVHSPKTLAEIQVFSCKTVQDALEVARVDKRKQLSDSIETFRTKVGAPIKTMGGAALKQPEVLSALKEVVEAAPNNLSAKYLLLGAEGRLPKTLSLNPSLRQIFIAASGMLGEELGTEDGVDADSDLSLEEAVEIMNRIKGLRPIISKELHPLHSAMFDLSRHTCNYKKAREIKNAAAIAKYEKAIDSSGEAMIRSLKKLSDHQEVLEELLNP